MTLQFVYFAASAKSTYKIEISTLSVVDFTKCNFVLLLLFLLLIKLAFACIETSFLSTLFAAPCVFDICKYDMVTSMAGLFFHEPFTSRHPPHDCASQ